MNAAQFVNHLDRARKIGDGWMARCPAHDDAKNSLKVSSAPDGKVLLHCHAGCETKRIVERLGLRMADLFPDRAEPVRQKLGPIVATYDYFDETGELAHQTTRHNPKDFRQRRKNSHGWVWNLDGVRTVLYRLPELLAADLKQPVFLVEGEKDADNLARLGLIATTAPMGAAAPWLESYSEFLRGRIVVVIPDNDELGRRHAREAAKSLQAHAASVKILELPDLPAKGDVSDWLGAGGTVAQLLALAELLPAFVPPGQTPAPAGDASKHKPSDDIGITRQLADEILKGSAFAQDGGGKLYVFEAGTYKPRGERLIKQRVKTLLNEWGKSKQWSTHRAEQVVAYIGTDAPILWERPPQNIISVRNGLLNVQTLELKPHSPDYLSAVQLPVQYDPEADCPGWDRFVATTFPADALDVAWQIVAWLMSAWVGIQKAILLLGEGANGKSTFLAALVAFLGKPNIASISLHKLETDKFAAARLIGKLANVCPDLPSAHLAGTSTFKALTGGDTISAEYKYRDSFEFDPFARLIFSANHPPQSTDASYAFFRRWLVIPFSRTFEPSEQIPREQLDAELSDPSELSGVLNKALAALGELRANGFTETQSMQAAWNEFRETTDPLAVWLDAQTIANPDAFIAKHELIADYNQDCGADGRPTVTNTAFGRAMKRIRPDLQEAQRTIAGKIVHVWLGIGRKSNF